MRRAAIGILAGVVGSALAVWYRRRQRPAISDRDYARMAEGII
jgi:hypothetical protein